MTLYLCFCGKMLTHFYPFDLRSGTEKKGNIFIDEDIFLLDSNYKSTIAYNPAAIHSRCKSSPLTSCVSDLPPGGVMMEGLLWRIALAVEVQWGEIRHVKIRTFDSFTHLQRMQWCLYRKPEEVLPQMSETNLPISGLVSFFSEMDVDDT